MTGTAISILDAGDIEVMEGEPRINDLVLGAGLGFSRPENVRKIVGDRQRELAKRGNLLRIAVKSGRRGRPGFEYFLNRDQALLVCMWSRAPNAEIIRAEIVTVFGAYLDGKPPPVAASPISDAVILAQLARREDLAPINDRLAAIEARMERMGGGVEGVATNVVLLHERINDFVPRRVFSKADRDLGHYVVAERYSGECPCCIRDPRTRIVGSDRRPIPGVLQWDHFNGREQCRGQDGWPVCAECNLALRDAQFKNERRALFDTFQRYRLALKPAFQNGGQPSLFP